MKKSLLPLCGLALLLGACSTADFAYGMSSLVGTALIDTKDFRRYAYQRKTVEQWAEDFADLAVSPMEKKVGRTSISISPF